MKARNLIDLEDISLEHGGRRFFVIRRDEGLLPGPHDPLSIRFAPKAEGLGLVRGGMARFFAGRGRVKIARGEIADNRLLHGPDAGSPRPSGR